jgi:WhiB family transcriptional regulator, redox-sensing transcriptional regulator
MSVKITLNEAADRYGVTKRSIHRWVIKYEIKKYQDGTFDRDELDAVIRVREESNYMDIDWDRAACKNLPTEFFFKIEDRGVSKLIDVGVFRFTCLPCPIWEQCLRYAVRNENYGVWGGMTSEERKAIMSNRPSEIKSKVYQDFSNYGVSQEMLDQILGKE